MAADTAENPQQQPNGSDNKNNNNNPSQNPNGDTAPQASQDQQQPAQQPHSSPTTAGTMTYMQLRAADIPPAPPIRASRKRKSPSSATEDAQAAQAAQQQPPPPPQPQAQAQAQVAQQQQQQPPPGVPQHPGQPMQPPPHAYSGLPPPAGSVYPPPMHYGYHPGPPPPGAEYAAPGMMPPGAPMMQGPPPTQPQPDGEGGGANRQLSTSKRAEQNRKAQRAFRERRDQHVKALEQRSQLLDAALAGADEANRRWEECRALVDQLRIENTALRTALTQAQATISSLGGNAPASGNAEEAPNGNENGEAAAEANAAT